MNGETPKQCSGWTIETLKDYLEEQQKGSYARLELAVMHTREMVTAGMKASQVALDKVEHATAAKFASVNEFRGAISDQSDRMMPRIESEARHKATLDRIDVQAQQWSARFDGLSTRLDDLNRRLLLREGAEAGTEKTKELSLSVIGIVVAAIGIISSVLGSVLATIMRPMGLH